MNLFYNLIDKYPLHPALGGNGSDTGIEQNREELNGLCQFIAIHGIRFWLEIGIAKGQLLKFMRDEMRQDVLGVTMDKHPAHAGLPVLYGDSKDPLIITTAINSAPFSWWDMIFVDGDHSYEGVRADFENYKSACKFMAFHDLLGQRNCEGVAKLWSEIKEGYPHEEIICEDKSIASGIGIIRLR